MEVAALRAGKGPVNAYRSLVRCDVPDTPRAPNEDGSATGISEAENQKAPPADEVFAHMHRAFALDQATVVMWAGTAYRFHAYAREKGLVFPGVHTRVIDLQTAAALYLDLKTADCKTPQKVLRVLNLGAEADCWSQGSLPFARAMNVIMTKLTQDGWTPEATPTAITAGSDMDADHEEMRIERWEQLRERQNNLGIERRLLPEVTPAFILLDGEHVSLRHERFARLIEVALVVAERQEREGGATYALAGTPYSSLVQVERVEDTTVHAWEITGIDPQAVRRAPPLPQVMAEMAAAAPWDRGVLVTWGPDDAAIITQNCVKTGIPSPITELPLVDLQRAFSSYYDLGRQQVSLQNAAAHLEIDTSQLDLHRALADTVLTWHVLDRMLKDGWTPHFRTWHRRQAVADMATASE
jgi:inhibitor of KinA sporulation pathway (predicted exonuclease)